MLGSNLYIEQRLTVFQKLIFITGLVQCRDLTPLADKIINILLIHASFNKMLFGFVYITDFEV